MTLERKATNGSAGRCRVLLLRSEEGAVSSASPLEIADFEVVTAYSTDLHWTKMVSGGRWAAIVVEPEALEEIVIELAAEIEEIPSGKRPQIIVFDSSVAKARDLPTPLRGAQFFSSDEEIAAAVVSASNAR